MTSSLAGSKYLWLDSAENLRRPSPEPLRRPAGQRPAKTARAWAIKESLLALLVLQAPRLGRQALRTLVLSGPLHCRLNPIIDAAKTLERHEAGLLSLLRAPDHQRRALKASTRVIQAIKASARGYRNREHFKTAIYFHLGGSALPDGAYDPRTSRKNSLIF